MLSTVCFSSSLFLKRRQAASSSALTIRGAAGVVRSSLAGASLLSKSQQHNSISSRRSFSRLNEIVLWRQRPFQEKVGHYLRIVRLPIVAYGIYTIGYRQGVIHSHQNPHKFQKQLLDSILLDSVKDSVDRKDIDVEVLSEDDLKGKNAASKDRYHQVAHVAQQIINEGRKHIDAELITAKEEARAKFAADVNAETEEEMALLQEQLEEQYDKDCNVKLWTEAKVRIDGDELNVEPWRFIFVGGGAPPNAWVTEMLPKRVFITKNMLELTKDVDEMAFLLGHEISHFILGHLSQSNELEYALKTSEIVLLSLDPTAGLVTFAVIALLDLLRRSIEMAFSREQEREADNLGLRLVARCDARYDLEAGARFMHRVHQFEGGGGFLPLLDSHPPSLERSRQLYKDSLQLAQTSAKSE